MKHKHLTYDDRLIIQQELENNYSLHKIAQRLHKSDSTIAREIIRNRYQVKTSASHTALCARVNVCAMETCAPLIAAAQAVPTAPKPAIRPAARTTSRATARALPRLRTAVTAALNGLPKLAGMSSSVTMLSVRRSLQTTC